MKIRGYNNTPHNLTTARMDELKAIGYNAYRVVEPYGFFTEEHLRGLLVHGTEIYRETIVTLFNSNPDVWKVVTPEIKAAFLAKEKQDEGRATRLLFALGIRGKHKGILNWMIDEALRLKRLVPGQTKIELWNPDIQYWATDWKNWLTLDAEFLPLFQMLNPGVTPTYTGFSYLAARLHEIWPGLLFREIRGGFMYGESWGVDTVGLQSSIMEYGANVHEAPQKFMEMLPLINQKYRVYSQWLTDPAFDGYSNIAPEVFWDVEKVKEVYAQNDYPGDSYSMLPCLGWDAIHAFASS